MNKARDISLIITLLAWATLIGAVMYSHVVFFSTYLYHLPASTSLISGPHGIQDERFWILIHPISITTLVIALILNWKLSPRRKFILFTLTIYVIALVTTFIYFVPELKAFANSSRSEIPASEWLQRGKKWENLSWIRGSFMYLGFLMLLIALVKNRIPAEKKTFI